MLWLSFFIYIFSYFHQVQILKEYHVGTQLYVSQSEWCHFYILTIISFSEHAPICHRHLPHTDKQVSFFVLLYFVISLGLDFNTSFISYDNHNYHHNSFISFVTSSVISRITGYNFYSSVFHYRLQYFLYVTSLLLLTFIFNFQTSKVLPYFIPSGLR